MFSHMIVGVSDFARSLAFYTRVMQVLGIEQRFCEPDRPWAGWHDKGQTRPFFVIARPFDGQPHHPGNGQMVAFTAASREQVRNVHRAALAAGGRCEGAPGPRPEYHPHYYGAYFRDPEGNKLCIVCHQPDAADG